ncbi:MAG: type II secretion system F family protein [Clostridia bacterium]|nr:type II secretion system F family protein [Clostridia bacterium]
MLSIIAISTFIAVMLFAVPILKYILGKQNSILRVRRYINDEEIKEEKKKAARKDFKPGLGFISKTVGSARVFNGYKKAIQFKLTKAHVLLKAEEYITVCLILFGVFGAIGLVASRNAGVALILGVMGWIIPSVVLNSKIKGREKQLNEQLCDAIILISNSLKAGYSFFQAVDTVAKEMTGPISEEFTLLQKEINLGLPTDKALENLVSRVSSDNLELVVTAVLIQRQVGGNLAEVLDNISSTIRDRVKIKGEIRTVTAQGRMSGIIISILPVALGIVLYLINPEHIGLLFKDPIGIAILVFSVFMELIGMYFISKIVKIEI